MSPQPIQLKRTKDWRMPANTLKVDRSTIYGNSFGGDVRTPKEAVAMFEDWLAILHEINMPVRAVPRLSSSS